MKVYNKVVNCKAMTKTRKAFLLLATATFATVAVALLIMVGDTLSLRKETATTNDVLGNDDNDPCSSSIRSSLMGRGSIQLDIENC